MNVLLSTIRLKIKSFGCNIVNPNKTVRHLFFLSAIDEVDFLIDSLRGDDNGKGL